MTVATAPETVRGLMRAGITHVVGIPDNTSGPLFHETARHAAIRLITVAREGEAFAIACGLWMGGASPLVVVQNTGLLEAGDSLRGTALRMAAPIPILVTGRGYEQMSRSGLGAGHGVSLESLTRGDVDSAAVLTEPTLTAWGVPYRMCGEHDDPVAALEELVARAQETERPNALVLTRALR
jgi:sulfopyruvate decarboxylase TPP-binding subunit